MFRNTYQSGFLSILYSVGSKPLDIWQKKTKNGHIKRITDEDIQSLVMEIIGANVSTTFISCPVENDKVLGIKLPFLVMIVKNMKKYFSFEVQILDDKNERRRFRASNYQSTTRVKPFICTMPMRLDDGWNQIQFNLADFTRRAYGTNYVETIRVSVHANCRLRRVYFSDRLYAEQELPPEFKLYLPVQQQQSGVKSNLHDIEPISFNEPLPHHVKETSEVHVSLNISRDIVIFYIIKSMSFIYRQTYNYVVNQ
ncbi:MAG: Cilia- and flagella-associated protein 20 [Paramarteilia canceri]